MRKNHHRVIHAESFKLVHSGPEYFSILEELIDGAKHEIHFQTYIFLDDETGKTIAEALVRAAGRGVKIYLLLDSYGSGDLPLKLVIHLRKAGIELRWYGKIFSGSGFHIARRLHRKIVLVDQQDALIGGINISNHYNKYKEKLPWLDYAILINDASTNQLYRLCIERWLKPRKKKLFRKSLKVAAHKMSDKPHHYAATKITLNENDYLRRKNDAAISYRKAITQAKESLLIVGGYFLPGGRARRLLRKAADRGVEIKVILAEESDVALERNAVQYLYQWLLRNKIKIYEYKPSNVHGKVLIADRKMVNIGSYDLNNLSTYSNIELNLDIEDAAFASTFADELEELIAKDCRMVTTEELYKRSNLWKRFTHWFSYQFVKTLFIMSVWLANRKDETYQ